MSTQITLTNEEFEALRVELTANVSRGIRSGRIGAIYYEMQGERLDILDIEILDGLSRDIDENQRYEIEEYVQAYS